MAGQSTEGLKRQDQVSDLGNEQDGTVKTRIAFLATLGHLHTEPLKYDLACLRSLVQGVEPDLLGIEMEPAEWEQGCLSGAPVEVRDALVPAAAVTDTVVVPLGGPRSLELGATGASAEDSSSLRTSSRTVLEEMRAGLLAATDKLLTGWQRDRATRGAEAVNSRLFGHVCGLLCSLEEVASSEAGRRAWEETNKRILEHLIEMVRRDPGRRVLVAVNCRRVHWLESRLRPFAGEMALVPYEQL